MKDKYHKAKMLFREIYYYETHPYRDVVQITTELLCIRTMKDNLAKHA